MEISKKGNDKLTSDFDPDLKDQVDCINRSLASLRSDIANIIRETVLQVMKEMQKPRKYVEAGYRG